MGKPSNLTPEQRTEIVLALLRREEPASILARRYGVSTKTPRACGGTGAMFRWRGKGPQDSPRMRGNPLSDKAETANMGPIPAHAGEPSLWRNSASVKWAYPRACGGTVVRCDHGDCG